MLEAAQLDSISPLEIFPNPAPNSFFIRTAAMDKSTSIEILNIKGQLLFKSEISIISKKKEYTGTNFRNIFFKFIIQNTKVNRSCSAII